MVPGFGVSAECQSIGTIEHNASPYWQDNGWPLNKDGSYCISSTSCQWFICFGSRPRHQTRAPWLGPPRLKKGKSNFFTNRNILHTLKNEPLNIILLHTSRTMDGP